MARIEQGPNRTDAELVVGRTVFGIDGDKIGKAGQVYLDDETGQPEWVTVNTGLFGTNESFVPLREARMTEDGVTVPYMGSQVEDAPNVSPDADHITPDQESQLSRYYGLDLEVKAKLHEAVVERVQGKQTIRHKSDYARIGPASPPVEQSLKEWQNEMHALLDSAGELPSGV